MREKTQKFIDALVALSKNKTDAKLEGGLQEFMANGGEAVSELVHTFDSFDEADAEEMADLHGGLEWFADCLREWHETLNGSGL